MPGFRSLGPPVFLGRVPVNKELFTGRVPVNKELITGTLPVNNLFQILIALYQRWGRTRVVYGERDHIKL